MAVSTYIIETSDFEGRFDISQNILTTKIRAQIGPTQEMFAIKLLCRDFYQEVLDDITTPASAVIATLLPFLKDFLVFKTAEQYLVSSNLMSTTAGMRVLTEATSEVASDKLMGEVMAQARERANFYQDTLYNFLELNEDDYPTWRDSICNRCGERRVRQAGQFTLVGQDNKKTQINWT